MYIQQTADEIQLAAILKEAGVLPSFPKLMVITGHYGSGKTNCAVNFARELARGGEPVVLFDLDIVNPYFRSSDFTAELAAEGIEVCSPVFANTNLDTPTLTGRLDAVLAADTRTIILDVGGDDAGAVALGRYAAAIARHGYRMYYVCNCFRYLTRTAEEAATLLRQIEAVSRLRVTDLVNNANLGVETSADDVRQGLEMIGALSAMTGLPVAMTTVRRDLLPAMGRDADRCRGVDIFVKPPW